MSYGLTRKSGLWFLEKTYSDFSDENMTLRYSERSSECLGQSSERSEQSLKCSDVYGDIGEFDSYEEESIYAGISEDDLFNVGMDSEEIIGVLTEMVSRVISEIPFSLDVYAYTERARELLSLIEYVRDSHYE